MWKQSISSSNDSINNLSLNLVILVHSIVFFLFVWSFKEVGNILDNLFFIKRPIQVLVPDLIVLDFALFTVNQVHQFAHSYQIFIVIIIHKDFILLNADHVDILVLNDTNVLRNSIEAKVNLYWRLHLFFDIFFWLHVD